MTVVSVRIDSSHLTAYEVAGCDSHTVSNIYRKCIKWQIAIEYCPNWGHMNRGV